MIQSAILVERVTRPLDGDDLIGSSTDVAGQAVHDGLEIQEGKRELKTGEVSGQSFPGWKQATPRGELGSERPGT